MASLVSQTSALDLSRFSYALERLWTTGVWLCLSKILGTALALDSFPFHSQSISNPFEAVFGEMSTTNNRTSSCFLPISLSSFDLSVPLPSELWICRKAMKANPVLWGYYYSWLLHNAFPCWTVVNEFPLLHHRNIFEDGRIHFHLQFLRAIFSVTDSANHVELTQVTCRDRHNMHLQKKYFHCTFPLSFIITCSTVVKSLVFFCITLEWGLLCLEDST